MLSARVKYLAGYYLYWLVYFLFMKAVFLIYHRQLSGELSSDLILGVFRYGLPLDLSFSAYISVIPFLLVAVSTTFVYQRWLSLVLMLYTNVVLFILTFLCTTDLELFTIWGFRLDASPLNYLNTPKEMMVSVGSSPLGLLIILNILINVFFSFMYRVQLDSLLPLFNRRNYYLLVPLLLLTGALLIPIRGGFQTIPINQSTVFFSTNHFANQAAVNLPWNFFHSLNKRKNNSKNPYLYLPQASADSLLEQLYETDSLAAAPRLLNNQQPNIILIIWESLTAKVVEPLGGIAGVTPRFNELSQEGLFFSRMYASGDRSDKGLVAILSGYPAQPTATIIKSPEKSRKLPQISQVLAEQGYSTSFYYGGDLAFANLGSYLSFGSWKNVVGMDDFEEEDRNSKWGAHDGVVLARMMQDLKKAEEPFFTTIFTLSSHEPFEIPAPARPRFPGKSSDDMFLSAHYYADSVIGAFIDETKEQPWWDNTLLIIVADHGHADPGRSQVYEPIKFHIPMLWLGGALEQKGAWTHTLSQTDIAASLLGQLDLPAREFPWSKNAFAPAAYPFAHYFYKDGVGFVTDSSYLSWDNVGKLLIEKNEKTGEAELNYAKGYLQKSYGDYLAK